MKAVRMNTNILCKDRIGSRPKIDTLYAGVVSIGWAGNTRVGEGVAAASCLSCGTASSETGQSRRSAI